MEGTKQIGTARERNSASDIVAAAEAVNAAHRDVRERFRERDSSPEAFDAWREAAAAFHRTGDRLYAGHDEMLAGLRSGQRSATDAAIEFLEVDPFAFRTGYAKERILTLLKRVQLDERQSDRLRAVVLWAIDHCGRREFRRYAHLAPHVADAGFRASVQSRLASSDPRVRYRAGWVLAAVDRGRSNL